MPARRIHQFDWDYVVDRYQEGYAIRWIADDIGTSYTTVRNILLFTNTVMRQRGKPSPRFHDSTTPDNPA